MYVYVHVYMRVCMCMHMSMRRFMCIGAAVYMIGAVEYTAIHLANPMMMVVFRNKTPGGRMGV